MPPCFLPLRKGSDDKSLPRALFSKEMFIADTSGAIMIMLTFGLAFPPLNVAIILAVFSKTTFMRLQIGSLLLSVESEGSTPTSHQYLRALHRDGAHCLEVCAYSIRYILPLAAVFHGFLLFDIVGGETGAVSALWAPLILLSVSLLLLFHEFVVRSYNGRLLTLRRFFQSIGDSNSNKVYITGEKLTKADLVIEESILQEKKEKAAGIDTVAETEGGEVEFIGNSVQTF